MVPVVSFRWNAGAIAETLAKSRRGPHLRRMSSDVTQRIAVCSWSLQPGTPQELLDRLSATGIRRVQLALDPLREHPAVWGQFPSLAQSQGIEIVSGMFGTLAEDYSSLDSIRLTGGVVPDATWDQNWRNIQAVAGIARDLGLRLVTFHAGFIPHESSDPSRPRLMDRLGAIADLFAAHRMDVAFETGQETADTLAESLKALAKSNVGVNFDPANMLLYDKGNPIEALRKLLPWLRQVHVKDANRTLTPGTWGEEVVVGTGQVDWKSFFNVLAGAGYQGNCCIEREAGSSRVDDIRAAHRFIVPLLNA